MSFASHHCNPLGLFLLYRIINLDGKQNGLGLLFSFELFFFFQCGTYFVFYPGAFYRMFGKNDQELVVKTNSFFNAIGKFFTYLQVFWGKPTTYAFTL